MDDIMVSVCVTTYNHEKYVAQALDSIIAQKTKYSMEVLVGDDCSTDNTQAILRQYEKQYPGFFKMFYRKRNMYHSIPTNSMDLRSRACGKYVIILEGDDYWTDNHKLEEQIDFLEGHQEYLAVAHNCVAVNETSQPNGENYPECKENEYTLNHFLHGVVPGQLTTLMYRNNKAERYFDDSVIEQGLTPGDQLLYFSIISNGRIYCMQKIMSAYRHITQGGSSYSANYKYRFEDAEKWNRALLQYSKNISNRDSQDVAEQLYYNNIVSGIIRKHISFSQARDYLRILDKRCGRFIKYIVIVFGAILHSR